MTAPIGHDHNGKPIYPGNLCRVVQTSSKWQDRVGEVCRIIDAAAKPGYLITDLPPPAGVRRILARPGCFEVIEEQAGSWSEVTAQTGWIPGQDRDVVRP